MTLSRSLAGIACVATITATLAAQLETRPAAAPVIPAASKLTSVMAHIPSGSLGFVAFNNIKSSLAAAERFLSAIAVAEMIAPEGEEGWLLEMLKDQAMLSEGFDPNGGLAIVMLDPHQFGLDLSEILGISQSPGATTQPSVTTPPTKPPLVVLVPGKGIEEIFGKYSISRSGKFQVVALPLGAMLAARLTDYVALSPSSEALEAVLSAERKATDELTKRQQDQIAGSDIALHVNMKVAGPMIIGIMKRLEPQMSATSGPGRRTFVPPELLSFYMSIYRDLILQIDSVTVGLRLAETGLVITERVVFSPDSEWALALADLKLPEGKLLDRIPDLPYVLAYGGGGETTSGKIKKLACDMLDRLFATKLMESIDEETKTKTKELTTASYDQITGFQFVLGGAPEGSGLFALAYVLNCRDSEATRAMLSELPSVYESMTKALLSQQGQDIEQLEISYLNAAESIDQTPVDAIDVSHPKLTDLSEEDRRNMVKVLGEERIRFRLATPDANTVVITFGGGKAMLAEAIKSATSGGTVMGGKETAQAMKYMPAKPSLLMLFNAGNLMDLIAKGMHVLDPQSQPFPVKIETRTPIAIGAGISGKELEVAIYVPNDLIKEAVGVFQALTSPPAAAGATTRPATTPSDEDQ